MHFPELHSGLNLRKIGNLCLQRICRQKVLPFRLLPFRMTNGIQSAGYRPRYFKYFRKMVFIPTYILAKICGRKFHRIYISRIGGIGQHLMRLLVVFTALNFPELITGPKYGSMAIKLPVTKKWWVCM